MFKYIQTLPNEHNRYLAYSPNARIRFLRDCQENSQKSFSVIAFSWASFSPIRVTLIFTYLLFIILLLHCMFIFTFTKVLTMFHISNHPLKLSPLFPRSFTLETVSPYLIFLFHTRVHNISTAFSLLQPFVTSSSNSLVLNPRQEKF
jgi:hypothetical protein